ncbi:hypothetical protein F4813DRAFT_313633 [Daldinia decipiens]|uniref:uncharacterized protein n=1 Tax=Daldinia decipiens TaxID=326647 RepID=UPI0020C40BFD|nr:uncharacterized protein F4813DRAFT_313633 [Daldinia decipiens]KAI1660111.1 hypothetical protein F4813DRAFT_313633 [Daldinia decipiens]
MLSQQLAQQRAESQDPPPPLSDPTPAPRGSLIDAAIDQLLKDQPSEDDVNYISKSREKSDLIRLLHVHVECNDGDTLVIVDFPSGYLSCAREEWISKRFCVHSEKLLATGSKVFANLLSSKKQARFRKRLELAGEILLQKFIIDLTPSAEGDDLAAQLIGLSLPPGVTDWWTSKERLGISPYLVSGHDDHCPHHDEVPIDCVNKSAYIEQELGLRERLPTIDLVDIETIKSRTIDDYCPIRHRVNIVRLLLAIEGYDLVLNSASRVYTLTSIASILDCTRVIRDSVYTWLLAEPNTEFIDINAEVAFKIAWTLEIDSITRAAFRILVVEKALDTLAAQPPAEKNQYTIFGRPRVDLPDDLQTVIQYAAQKLADRVHQTLAKFRSDQFYEVFEISEYRKFVEAGDIIRTAISTGSSPSSVQSILKTDSKRDKLLDRLLDSFSTLYTKLQEYKDYIIQTATHAVAEYDQQSAYDRDRRCYVEHPRRIPTSIIASNFTDAQHLLTPWFWVYLASYPVDYLGPCYLVDFLTPYVDDFNDRLIKATPYLPHRGSSNKVATRFHLENFRIELHVAVTNLWTAWTSPDLEVSLTRTQHIVLSLSEDEFQYLPLWAGGLNDGSGGVFQSTVPDADLGPIGPGPAYRTGNTVATDTSSICQSDKTPSEASTATLTAGRSVNAVPSNMGPSTVHDGTSVSTSDSRISFTPAASTAGSTATLDRDDSDGYESDDSDEIDEDAWSQVEEPLT